MAVTGGFWKLGPVAAVIGVLMIIGYVLIQVFKVPAEGAGLLLFFGIVMVIGGISGGVWIYRRDNR